MAETLSTQERPGTSSTIKFVEMFDKVFDCLNVSNINKGRKNKKELKTYESPNDWRFKVHILTITLLCLVNSP